MENSVLGWGGKGKAQEHIKEGFPEDVTSELSEAGEQTGQVFQAAGTVCAKAFHSSAPPGHRESERAVLFSVRMPRNQA